MLPPFTRFVHTMKSRPMTASEHLDGDLDMIVRELAALAGAASTLGLDGIVDKLAPIRIAAADAQKRLGDERAEWLAEINRIKGATNA